LSGVEWSVGEKVKRGQVGLHIAKRGAKRGAKKRTDSKVPPRRTLPCPAL
jgi:hypothetical protein